MKTLILALATFFASVTMFTAAAHCGKCGTGDKHSHSDAKKTAAACEKCTADAMCEGCKAKKAAACTKCADGKACEKCAAKKEAKDEQASHNLSTTELAGMIASKKPVVILDARTAKYDDGNRIPGASLIGPAPSADQLAKLIADKDAQIVTYCGSTKCPLSGMLAGKLKKMGYTNVSEYPEGMKGWVDSGQTVAKAE